MLSLRGVEITADALHAHPFVTGFATIVLRRCISTLEMLSLEVLPLVLPLEVLKVLSLEVIKMLSLYNGRSNKIQHN